MSDVANIFKSLARILIYLLYVCATTTNKDSHSLNRAHLVITRKYSVYMFLALLVYADNIITHLQEVIALLFFPSLKHNNNIHARIIIIIYCNTYKHSI